MKTIEDRLATVVSLLPAAAQPRFAAPFGDGESADTRLVEAVQALAKAESLVCHTKEELARVKARLPVPVTQQSAPDTRPPALAQRIATCNTPQEQTAIWRGLTPMEKIEAVRGR